MSVIDDYQQKLVKHFTQLSKERAGTVFLLEHPLSIENINEIKSFIRSLHIDIQNLRENYYAVLLVLLTETGYNYAGNGTDFWNTFENDLKLATITNTERLQIRDKFKNQQLFWHIAKPSDTNWANQFSIIANPIVNAVLPLDIRFTLIETLRAIPIQYFEKNQRKNFQSYIQNFSLDSYSSRYKNWLLSFPFVDEFVLALTQENEIPHLLKNETLNRICRDCENDKIAGKSLRDLRKKYHQWKKLQPLEKATAAPKEFAPKRIYKCDLFLKYENNKWTLNGQLHIKFLECIVHNPDLKRKLQLGQWTPKAWNCFSVKPTAFLQQELFEIPPMHWNKIKSDVPFIKPPEDRLSKIRDAVDAIRFNFDCPAVFEPVADIESTVQYKQCSAKITANTGIYICILHENDTNTIEGISLEYSAYNYHIFCINTNQSPALDWAKSHGIEVKQPSSWNWIAPLGHIDHNKKLLSVLPNDKFFLNIKNNAEIQVQFNNEPAQNVSGIIAFESGNYSVVIVDDKLKEDWNVAVIERQEETLPFFSAELIGEPTVSQLKKQALSITFDSIYSFKNVNCRIVLTNKSNEKSIFYSDLLENFNETFSYTRLFSKAFEENESEFKNNFWSLVNSQKDLQLELDIQGVLRKQWTLESVLNGIWWEEINTNNPIAKSDDEEYNVQEILHQERYPLYPADCRIYRAIKKDDNPVPVYRAETILRCQSKLELGSNILKTPERIIRRNKDTKNSVGLANIIDDMLAFRQAQTTNAVEEMIRCKIIEELESIFWTITCGKIWTDTFITQKSVVYYLKQWIYPPQIADELYSQKKSFQTPSDVLATFERCKTDLLRQSPYSEFWKTEQVVNNFSCLFYYPSKFDYAFKEQTTQTALLDRQLLRIFSFLVLLQKENQK